MARPVPADMARSTASESRPHFLQRRKTMKHDEKPATSPKSRSPEVPDESGKHKLGKTMKDEPHAPDGSAQEIDRPGFDLGGSSGDTHAGTGLGLGVDASDTAGDRRLPGRRPDNKLTIPRWSGPEPEGRTDPARKPSGSKP